MTPPAASPAFLQGGGAMGERIRAFDWASHPLGPTQDWPAALRMAISLCLNSSFPTAVYWGPELYVLYNDAWSQIPADKHPWMLGRTAREGWSDIWPIIGPQLQQVLETGEGLALYDQMLPMVRGGRARETWWNYSFTAIRDAQHGIGGVFNQGNEVTQLVKARQAREEELGRWREAFRQAPAGIALLRGPQHVFELANEAYLKLVGGRDVEGLPVAEALPEVAEQGFLGILDRVYRTGEPYLATGASVKLKREAGEAVEDRVLDFIYQPVRDPAGAVDRVFVLVTDVTDRARAESALRITNWQLGEERARLAAMIEAEQRSQQALRRFNDALESHVKSRTAELTLALAAQQAVADRLRAAFDTQLMFQGFLDVEGTVVDTNAKSLASIRASLADVAGRPFWQTAWFAATPGMPERIRAALAAARAGALVQEDILLRLPDGESRFRFSVRPVRNAAGEVVGLVPEAVELPGQPS